MHFLDMANFCFSDATMDRYQLHLRKHYAFQLLARTHTNLVKSTLAPPSSRNWEPSAIHS